MEPADAGGVAEDDDHIDAMHQGAAAVGFREEREEEAATAAAADPTLGQLAILLGRGGRVYRAVDFMEKVGVVSEAWYKATCT